MENLVDLLNKVPGSDETDADYIKRWFSDHGYSCTWVTIKAQKYGSFAHRTRLWFFAVKGPDFYDERASFIMELMQAMTIDPIPLERFIGDPVLDDSDEPSRFKKPKGDCKYHTNIRKTETHRQISRQPH